MKRILIVNFSDRSQWATEVPYLWLILKSYFMRNSKDPSQWEWLDPLYSSEAEHIDDIIDNIVYQKPDVMGISCYVWNEKMTLHIAQEVKKKLPDIRIIAGGPGVYLDQDKGWFSKHPYVEAVCEYTGHGEVFITEYLDGTPLKDIPFCIYPTLGGSYWNKSSAVFSRRDFKFSQPYVDNQEYLKKFAAKHEKIKVIVETSRGCPYACTFCEWGYPSSNKVVFRNQQDIIEDIETAIDIIRPYTIDIVDANFGIHNDNVALTEKIVELNDKYGKTVTFVDMGGPTKVRKHNLKAIYETLLNGGIMVDSKLAIQHTDEEVLDNVDRVEVPLAEQIEIFKPMFDRYDIELRVEAIMGLPGETPDKFYKMMDEMTIYPSLEPWCHQWMMLPGTPSADPDYMSKMQLKTKEFVLSESSSEYDFPDQVIPKDKYQKKVERTGIRKLILDDEWLAPHYLVVSSYSYDCKDWAEVNLFYHYYTLLRYNGIIVPLTTHLRSKNVNIAEFYKGLFREYLMGINLLEKSYRKIIADVESDEPADFEYIDISENFPYMSHRALLKFVILMSPDGFFTGLREWLETKYGEDDHIRDMCKQWINAVKSPAKSSMSIEDKAKACFVSSKQVLGDSNKIFPTDFELK